MKKVLKLVGISLLFLIILLAIFLRLRFGGGIAYEDISTAPVYGPDDLKVVYAHDEPIGNVAASKDTTKPTRIFFTIHPESRPETIKLMEITNGQAKPYPSLEQQNLFTTVLGLFTDQQNRLWSIDHGNHGFGEVKVIAFDLDTDKVVKEYVFPKQVAKRLSFFNDLSVSPDGKLLVVANVSFFGKKPSMAVYNLETGESRNLLEKHESVGDQGFVPITPYKKMSFFGGLVDLLTGIDGIDFSRDGKYVYYAPMGHSELFRIPTKVISDFSLSSEEIEAKVESLGKKPLSDGIRTDYLGNVYITDIENSGVFVLPSDGKGYTLVKDQRIRWADGLSLAGDGTFYLADSDIPNQMLQSKDHIRENAPYYIYSFQSLDTK
ncbi:MAG: L-dopachrome tautomerase-related protein [Bacteroidota bacterium]